MNKTKKPAVKARKSINFNKLKIRTAKFVAFVSLIVLASYGLRNLLHSINDTASLIITSVAVLDMVYILSLKEEE